MISSLHKNYSTNWSPVKNTIDLVYKIILMTIRQPQISINWIINPYHDVCSWHPLPSYSSGKSIDHEFQKTSTELRDCSHIASSSRCKATSEYFLALFIDRCLIWEEQRRWKRKRMRTNQRVSIRILSDDEVYRVWSNTMIMKATMSALPGVPPVTVVLADRAMMKANFYLVSSSFLTVSEQQHEPSCYFRFVHAFKRRLAS